MQNWVTVQQPTASRPGGEEAGKKARPRKRKGREEGEGQHSEPRAARVRKAQKGTSEGTGTAGWLGNRAPTPRPGAPRPALLVRRAALVSHPHQSCRILSS